MCKKCIVDCGGDVDGGGDVGGGGGEGDGDGRAGGVDRPFAAVSAASLLVGTGWMVQVVRHYVVLKNMQIDVPLLLVSTVSRSAQPSPANMRH